MTSVALLRDLARPWPSPVVKRIVRQAAPAAGAEFTFTVPGDKLWLPVALIASLVCNSTVASRAPGVTISDGTTTVLSLPSSLAVTASNTGRVSWIPNLQATIAAATGNDKAQLLPNFALQPGWKLSSLTTNLQSADQWSTQALTVLEVFTGDVEHEASIEQSIIDRLEAVADILESRG